MVKIGKSDAVLGQSILKKVHSNHDFKSYSQWVSRCAQRRVQMVAAVSIRAPAWGATRLSALLFTGRVTVSINASVWGTTRENQTGFLPQNISIHISHVGCDHSRVSLLWVAPCFNSRTRVGCDGLLYANTNNAPSFQFTYPHGVRPVV